MLQRRVVQRRIPPCFPGVALLGALCLLVAGLSLVASAPQEEALRTRVEQMYTALERGDYSRVEKYLTKDSKQIYRGQEKKPLLAHEIESIKLEPGGDTATVVVRIPATGSSIPQLTYRPQRTQWRLIKGVWYAELSQPNPKALDMLRGTAHLPAKLPPPPHTAPSPTELKFESTWVGFEAVHHGEVKVARFPFTNITNHDVTVEVTQRGCDCLRLKTQQKEFKAGESAVLEFEFDPSQLQFNTEQAFTTAVVLKIQPGGEETALRIAALLEPGNAPPASSKPPQP